MKTGRNLQELAAEIQRRAEAKRDFIVPTDQITMDHETAQSLTISGMGDFKLNNHAHRQLGTHIGIPAKYYDRCREEAPALLAYQANHWLRQPTVKKNGTPGEIPARMVRTLDGTARAFLSDRYRRMDNEQVAERVLPVLMADEALRVESCEITDRRLYIKAVSARVQADVKVGDAVQAGVIISNSEIGAGSLSVSPMVFRLVCLNGMICPDNSMRAYHVGRSQAGEGVEELLRDETKAREDEAIMMKLEDLTRAAFDEVAFGQWVGRMREATEGEQIRSITGAAVELQKRFNVTDGEKDSILTHLAQGGDMSRYGMLNAVTRASQDVEDYDRATELEAMGGQILDLKPSEWQEMAFAEAA